MKCTLLHERNAPERRGWKRSKTTRVYVEWTAELTKNTQPRCLPSVANVSLWLVCSKVSCFGANKHKCGKAS